MRRLPFLAARVAPALALASALALTSGAASANPLDTYGFGSRETAMGGAVSANVRGTHASYYNPAGLADTTGFELALGYFRAAHYLSTNGQDNQVDPVRGMNGGLVLPGHVFEIPIAFGLGLHLPDDRISRVRALRQEQPRWEMYDNRNQRLYFATNLALRPVKWLAVGGGLSFMSSTRGRLDITGSANIFRPSQSEVRHEVDADLTAVRYPQAGVRVDFSDRVRAAVVYRGEFQLGLDLSARLRGDISRLTTALYELETHSVNNFLPRQIVVGGSVDIRPWWTANLDLTWLEWSAYVAPVATLDVNLDIPPPQGGWPATITPPETPGPIRLQPLRLSNRIVPRVGTEVLVVQRPSLDVAVRGGYEWAKTPIEPQTASVTYLDLDRHTISGGAGVAARSLLAEIPGEIRLDVHGQLSVMPEETTLKARPSDFTGDYRASGHIWNLGTTVTFTLDGAPRREAP